MDIISGDFVWDDSKERENVHKHGVDFTTAALVFVDPNIKIFRDWAHSSSEERLFGIGIVKDRVLTVRFSYRDGLIRIIGAGHWRKGKRYYEET